MIMKLATLLSVSMLATGSAFAAATATSENVFGVLRVDSPYARTVVAVPWVAAGVEAGDIKVTDLVKTSNLTPADDSYTGDTLSYYDSADSKKFKSWRLVSGESGAAPHWEAATSVVANGDPQPGTDENVQGLPRGGAIILVRKDPVNKPFYLQGQVAAEVATSQTIPASTEGVFHLIAPPCVKNEGIDINGTDDMEWSNPDTGDRIYVYQANGLNAECRYANKNDKLQWWWGKYPEGAGLLKPTWENPPALPVGTGFWYYKKGSSATTVTWKNTPHK